MTDIDDKLIRELYEVRAEIKSAEEREKEILAELNLKPKKDRFVSGDYLVDTTPTVRFNAELAKSVLTKKEWESILRPAPQSTIAKALYPEKYARMQKTSGVTVTVKIDE